MMFFIEYIGNIYNSIIEIIEELNISATNILNKYGGF